MTHARLIPLVILIVTPTVALAQKPPQACPLLKPAEISEAMGMSVGESHETDAVVPSGPSKGEPMTGCTWLIGKHGAVSIGISRAATGERREQGLAKFRAVTQSMRAKGWTGDEKKIGSAWCGTFVPPPDQKEHTPVMVTCMGEAKGLAMAAYSMILNTPVAPEKVKTLLDDALKRLP